MLKAIHGGGGRGMMIVQKKSDLENSMNLVRTEAKNAFGNGDSILKNTLIILDILKSRL